MLRKHPVMALFMAHVLTMNKTKKNSKGHKNMTTTNAEHQGIDDCVVHKWVIRNRDGSC